MPNRTLLCLCFPLLLPLPTHSQVVGDLGEQALQKKVDAIIKKKVFQEAGVTDSAKAIFDQGATQLKAEQKSKELAKLFSEGAVGVDIKKSAIQSPVDASELMKRFNAEGQTRNISPSELDKILNRQSGKSLTTPQIQKILSEYQPKEQLKILNSRQFNIKIRPEVQQVIGGYVEGGGELKAALVSLGLKGSRMQGLGMPEASVVRVIEKKAADKTSCPMTVAVGLEDARRAVESEPPKVAPQNRLNEEEQRLRRYLRTPIQQRAQYETEEGLRRLVKFEAAWRAALANCFDSPHNMPAFLNLKSRVGTFEGSDNVSFCTGLLVADGVVLTARHCFAEVDVSAQGQYKKVRFRTADDNLLEVDVGAAISTASPSYSWEEDQLLVPVSKRGMVLDPISRESDVEPFYSTEQTTSLLLVAALPLARDLAPDRFPTGFVISRQPNTCFVAFKQEGCITHMCSVTPGSSGASVFSNQATPKWLGIHVGPESNLNSCSPMGGRVASNYAVRRFNSELAQYIK